MLENISSGQYILSGYPRNEIFFEKKQNIIIKNELGLTHKSQNRYTFYL